MVAYKPLSQKVGGRACGTAQLEGLVGCRVEFNNSLSDIVSRPLRHFVVIGFNYYSHKSISFGILTIFRINWLLMADY